MLQILPFTILPFRMWGKEKKKKKNFPNENATLILKVDFDLVFSLWHNNLYLSCGFCILSPLFI